MPGELLNVGGGRSRGAELIANDANCLLKSDI